MSNPALARIVYVVDSDESVREGLSRLVSSAGFLARTCDTLDAFLRERPGVNAACVLLDASDLSHCEPALWGQLQARAAEVPIVALSARDDPMTRRIARALGAQALFRKPVDAAALLDSIEWVMRTRAPDQSG